MSIRNLIKEADQHLNQLEHKKYASLLTNYLRGEEVQETMKQSGETDKESPIICFACGGSSKRWQNFLETPKHLVDIGKSLPLLHYSVNQFICKIRTCTATVLIDRDQRARYESGSNMELIEREGDPEEDVAIEILSNQSIISKGEKDILLLMGDVAWSPEAVNNIGKHARRKKTLMVFGRSGKNDKHGNTGGEIFAAFIPYADRDVIRVFYDFCRRLYHGNGSFRMTRFSTWEVLALITAAGKISGKADLREIASPRHAYSISELHPAMKDSLSRCDFMKEIWSEINDETEDFDFPYEYISWLRRRVIDCAVK